MTLAAKKAPEPDPQVLIARRLIDVLGDVRKRQRSWVTRYPIEPWTDQLKALDGQLQAIQYRWGEIAKRAKQVHQQRIASCVKAEGA